MPNATVFRLLLATVPLDHAAVLALSEPETTLGSLALMRGLIEAWAHLYFIQAAVPAQMACRALRLERGWVADTVALAHFEDENLPGQLQKARQREAAILELWTDLGCKAGRPRRYGDVRATIKDIETKFRIDWLLQIWSSASQTSHVSGWDWLLVDHEDGGTRPILPMPSHRAGRLNHLTVLFSNVGSTALHSVQVDLESAVSRRFHNRALTLLDDPFLKRAIDGDFDD
jgi:hypothetical protein